ncbi:hypothetical protein SBBP2_460021 [Burkholderiales bacterium]|nr:hypothetical protein SBBP2_460021 [Burkholderiales bacterium]
MEHRPRPSVADSPPHPLALVAEGRTNQRPEAVAAEEGIGEVVEVVESVGTQPVAAARAEPAAQCTPPCWR